MERQEIFFREEQKMKNPWIWLVFAGVALLFFSYLLFRQIVLNQPVGSEPMSDKGLIFISVGITLVFVIAWLSYRSIRMITEVRSDGIYILYRPYMRSGKLFHYDNITGYEKTELFLFKHGGPGIKKKPLRKMTTYLVFGRRGISLKLKSGWIAVIGTQRPNALYYAIEKAMQKR